MQLQRKLCFVCKHRQIRYNIGISDLEGRRLQKKNGTNRRKIHRNRKGGKGSFGVFERIGRFFRALGETFAEDRRFLFFTILIVAVFVFGICIAAVKYAPTRERMDLSDYFVSAGEDGVSVIVNGEYIKPEDNQNIDPAILSDGTVYLEKNFLQDHLDEGYVYDSTEGILRYTTDREVVTANLGSSSYEIGRTSEQLDHSVLISENDTVYIASDFVALFTDFTSQEYTDPARIVIDSAGETYQQAVVRRKDSIRRLGGPKSLITADVSRGDTVRVISSAGKWTQVLTENGEIGYIKTRRLKDQTEKTVAALLPERTYNHILLDDGTVCLLWHQVTNTRANAAVSDVIDRSPGITVISPTWFTLNDNSGGLSSIASMDYVNTAHSKNVEVWGLFSNLGTADVDTTAVLSVTSARDNLINNIIADAIAYDLDGVNIDFESLESDAADGYLEFIRELSLKCEANDLILSVDNYAPTSSTMFYNRANQADYADYVILMGYDEHYGGDNEAGSTASIDFVTQGVTDTLSEVPKEQLILGMPFYTRIWATDNTTGTLTSQSIGMKDIPTWLSEHGAAEIWQEDLGQNYAEATEGNITYQIWIEDTDSLTLKLKVMQSEKLAGCAFWKSGFEDSSAWTLIDRYLD